VLQATKGSVFMNMAFNVDKGTHTGWFGRVM